MDNFKVGDRVRIKSWDKMAEEYTEEKSGNGINLPFSRFDICVKHLCGLTATIKMIDDDGRVQLEDWSDDDKHDIWTYSTYMLEKVTNLIVDYNTSQNMVVYEPYTIGVEVEHTIDAITCGKNLLANCEFQTNFYDKYIKGIWENEEENEMRNEVLELWYKRKKENIYKKYKDLEDKYVEEHYEIVKQYNELIETFEKNLEDFCTKYSDITVNEDFVICKNADCNVYKYVIDKSVIRNDAVITYKDDKNKEYKELQLKYEDINALLSMSDDLEYQQNILIEYGIIDKKTKRMISNEDSSN